MLTTEGIINVIKTSDYEAKKQLLQYLLQMAQSPRKPFTSADKAALLDCAYGEVDTMLADIPAAENYQKKDLIFACEDLLLGLIMNICPSSEDVPQAQRMKIKALTELVNKERYIENTVDSIFEQPAVAAADITWLLYWVGQTNDEYQKSKLFYGLIHYQQELGKLSADAKNMLTDYIAAELQRLMGLDSQQAWNSLELLADVSKHFANEEIIAALQKLLSFGRNHINIYALDTLCALGADIPQAAIDGLARDLEYADTAYHTLLRYGKAALFPAECATEEYLAKSDMVRWLTYPTELGKAPDAIEYIGKIKPLFKKEVFHVFKYRTNSDTLGEDLRNKWLIGWSSNEGGTFSNFDEFAPYENEPTKKALRLIKKKLIG